MSELTNYIKERIETVKLAFKINPVSFHEWALSELQAVLSKIEELNK